MASKPSVPRTKLGTQGLEVSAQGLGCMGMSDRYGPPKPEQDMINLIRHAVAIGITFLDTSDAYGPHTNEILIGKAIKGIRDKVQVATKFAFSVASDGSSSIRGDPEYVRACCEASLKRLQVDCIDLFYIHRVDNRVPIEITVGEMKKLVEEGKVKYLGLSEASTNTIRRAHSVHPITAVQLEWSLWTREAEEAIIPTCRELGIGVVPFSPLARGFFSMGAKLVENLSSNDFRKVGQPRLQGENLEKNQALYENLQRLASRKGCTPGQVALAWVQHQGKDVVAIPGTTRVSNLEENAGAVFVELSKEEMLELESVFPPGVAKGSRYTEDISKLSFQDTPPLSSWQKSS